MTSSQRQALEDVEKHDDPWHRVRGQAQHGGWAGVMQVLVHRKKWIEFVSRKWELTEAGREALKKERKR